MIGGKITNRTCIMCIYDILYTQNGSQLENLYFIYESFWKMRQCDSPQQLFVSIDVSCERLFSLEVIICSPQPKWLLAVNHLLYILFQSFQRSIFETVIHSERSLSVSVRFFVSLSPCCPTYASLLATR